MTSVPRPAWTAALTVERASGVGADRLARALRPESEREVARGSSRIRRTGPADVVIEIEARDVGALRAALNTYLGWVRLAISTEESVPVAEGGTAAGEALI